MTQFLSGVITAIGLAGFFLAGKKFWWAWYVNIANQVLWTIFALATHYYAFLVGTAAYFIIFSINAYKWTTEHFGHRSVLPRSGEHIGRVLQVTEDARGMEVIFKIEDEKFVQGLQETMNRIDVMSTKLLSEGDDGPRMR